MVAFSFIAALAVATLAQAVPTASAPPAVQERGPMNFVMAPDHPLSKRFGNFSTRSIGPRSDTNYKQDYRTGGSVNFNAGTNSFTLNWNTQQDFVVGVGWKPGNHLPITHTGSFSVSSGLGSMGVYGWTTNPLVEYYIMETNVGINTGGSKKGTVTSDGATYDIWEHQQVNQPSIQGTSTFQQYISIRQSPTSSGTITIDNHFKAWAALGMNLGNFDYQTISVESWSGSGSASQQVTNTGSGDTGGGNTGGGNTGGGDNGGGNTGGGNTGGGNTGGGGSCSAQWGQCGGIGWSGPTCCASGSCHKGNDYYSQCY